MNISNNLENTSAVDRLARTDREGHRRLRTSLRISRSTLSRDFDLGSSENRRLTRLVLDEAEAIAWQTGFPQLVFPSLAEEKLRAAAKWNRRQQIVKRRAPRIQGFSA